MKLKNSFLKHSIRSLPLIFLMGSIFYATYYTIPKSSFASDSLVKVLQTKGWIESNFQSQEIYYLGKRLDPNFNFLLVQTIVSAKGEKIGPFPFANTLIATPFVWIGHPEWILYLSAFLFGLYLIFIYDFKKMDHTNCRNDFDSFVSSLYFIFRRFYCCHTGFVGNFNSTK
ncbi:hypothetical protein LEP1GSC018_1620 [Leptospira kirschneri str. 2008720114]|nr:hypothetical protein LEP1GSC018_1620 [Leptospira kirschneri str. 2008720114]